MVLQRELSDFVLTTLETLVPTDKTRGANDGPFSAPRMDGSSPRNGDVVQAGRFTSLAGAGSRADVHAVFALCATSALAGRI